MKKISQPYRGNGLGSLHDSWHTGSLRQQQFQFPR